MCGNQGAGSGLLGAGAGARLLGRRGGLVALPCLVGPAGAAVHVGREPRRCVSHSSARPPALQPRDRAQRRRLPSGTGSGRETRGPGGGRSRASACQEARPFGKTVTQAGVSSSSSRRRRSPCCLAEESESRSGRDGAGSSRQSVSAASPPVCLEGNRRAAGGLPAPGEPSLDRAGVRPLLHLLGRRAWAA